MPLPSTTGIAPDSYQTFEGTVTGLPPGQVDLAVAGGVHRLTATKASTFWRGGDVPISQLRTGDALLVKLAPDWTIGRGWANLARAHGQVTRASGSGYVIQAADIHDPTPRDMMVGVSGATRYGSGDHMSSQLQAVRPSMVPGTHIDVIGMRGPDGIAATTLMYSDPRLAAAQSAAAAQPAAQPTAAGDPSFKGYATWFNCNDGAGRCGTCNTSKNNQAAWPALDTFCGGCTGGCCNCSSGCKNQTFLSCGNSFTITPCGQGTTSLEISDCGPAQNVSLCGGSCNLAGCSGSGVVVDLTMPTFARFFSPEFGCFPTTVNT